MRDRDNRVSELLGANLPKLSAHETPDQYENEHVGNRALAFLLAALVHWNPPGNPTNLRCGGIWKGSEKISHHFSKFLVLFYSKNFLLLLFNYIP